MGANYGARIVLQAAYFVVLARSLGVSGFGAFTGVVALAAVLQPFGSLGVSDLMVMNVAREVRLARQQLALSLVVTIAAGTGIAALVTAVAPVFAPHGVSAWTVLAIAAADLLGARLVDVLGAAYQARERMVRTALFPIVLYGARLVGGLILVTVPSHTVVEQWALAYLAASALVAALLTLVTLRDIGWDPPDFGRYRREWRLGIQFAIGLTAQSIYNDIDKAMLARIGTLDAAGIYAAAYRVVDMSFTPMRALLAASYARVFVHGSEGLASVVRFTRKLAIPGVGYAFIASMVLLSGAQAIPLVLGHSYVDSVDALRLLAPLPMLKALHYLAANALSGSMLQRIRTTCQVLVAIANVALNFWLIPAYSWHGAVASSLISDGALAITLWTIVYVKLRGSPHRGDDIDSLSAPGAVKRPA